MISPYLNTFAVRLALDNIIVKPVANPNPANLKEDDMHDDRTIDATEFQP
jgi:hypothetical protein